MDGEEDRARFAAIGEAARGQSQRAAELDLAAAGLRSEAVDEPKIRACRQRQQERALKTAATRRDLSRGGLD